MTLKKLSLALLLLAATTLQANDDYSRVKVKTNALADLFLIPNLTVEYRFTSRWSASVGYVQSWISDLEKAGAMVRYTNTGSIKNPRTEAFVGIGLSQAAYHVYKSGDTSSLAVDLIMGVDLVHYNTIIMGVSGGFTVMTQEVRRNSHSDDKTIPIFPHFGLNVGVAL